MRRPTDPAARTPIAFVQAIVQAYVGRGRDADTAF